MVTSFGRYDLHQANAIQNLKMLVTCSSIKCQVVWDPIYINVNIF